MENEAFKILMDDPDRGLRFIIDKHGPQLLKQITRCIQNDDELVKDVFQLTLIAIWTDHKKIGELEDPFAWIMAIARNTALSTLRSERIRLKEPIEDHEDLRSSEQADTALVYKETLDELLQYAKQLTPLEKGSECIKSAIANIRTRSSNRVRVFLCSALTVLLDNLQF